jgi:hypothetical protein
MSLRVAEEARACAGPCVMRVMSAADAAIDTAEPSAWEGFTGRWGQLSLPPVAPMVVDLFGQHWMPPASG